MSTSSAALSGSASNAARAATWAAQDRLVESRHPCDDTVLEALAEQIRQWPERTALSLSSAVCRPVTKSIAGHVFDAIERSVGFTVSPHSLRHYFGASLISRGVTVVAVARWLGRSSPDHLQGLRLSEAGRRDRRAPRDGRNHGQDHS